MLKNIGLLLVFAVITVGCSEREGTVKWTDCREKISVKEGDIDILFKKFTCQYYRTGQGRIMGGSCVSIEYDSNGACKAAYMYEKRQDDVCSKQNPVLKQDDLCYPN